MLNGIVRRRSKPSVKGGLLNETAILEDSAECVVVLDLKGRLLRMNKVGRQLMKIKKFSEVECRPWVDLWEKGYKKQIKQAILRARKGKPEKLHEMKSYYKGRVLWWNVTIIPVFDNNNKPRQLLAMAHDITPQKETEQASRYYALLVQNVSDAIISADLDLKILSWNKGAEKLYGWRADEVLGKPAPKFIKTLFPNDDQEAVSEQILVQGSWRGEIIQTDKRGKRHDILATMSLLKDENGKNVGIVGVCRDVTEKNRTEKKLQKSNIEQQLIKHKAKILRQKNKELLALSRSKDEFIAITSHQLRTPATGVKQYIGLLLEGYAGPINGDEEVFLVKAYENNERQLRIVDDILRVAQLDLDKVKLHMRQEDIGELVEDAVSSLQGKFDNRGQKVNFTRPQKPVTAVVDSGQLRLAIENILENASNYSANNSKIMLTVRNLTAKTVMIRIRDYGVGIDPADFSRLFQKFSRIANTRSNNVSGTGLGLYFAHKILNLHQGDIEVQSATGKGTTFTLIIPTEPGSQ